MKMKGWEDVTEQREGVASVAELLGVVHAVDDGTAASTGVQEVVCAACAENIRRTSAVLNCGALLLK